MPSRYFALIPAAGHSSRMGQPKLLLPVAGKPLINHTIAAWLSSSVDQVVVVVRSGDEDLATAVRNVARLQVANSKCQIEVVTPKLPPPDMKASLQAALIHLEHSVRPSLDDAFLVAPADMPRLSPAIIRRLMERHQCGSKHEILTPIIRQQRGHPVLFPWSFSLEVFQLGEQEGLNAIVERQPIELIDCADLSAADQSPFDDIDTPEQYRQFTRGNFPGNTS